MQAIDHGTRPGSECIFCTPSDTAKELLYYLVSCGNYFTTDEYNIRRKSYPHPLILYVRTGTLRLEYDSKRYTIGSGEFAIFDCRSAPHRYYADCDGEFFWAHFDGLNTHELLAHINREYGVVFSARRYPAVVDSLIYLMDGHREDRQLGEGECAQLISTILFSLMPIGRINEAVYKQTSPVSQVIDYIHCNLNQDLSVKQLSALVFLSPYHFSRLFKNETGYSPYEYVIITRINHAKQLLLTTDMSLDRIAAAVGYHTEGRFINAFSQKVGISPGKFRKYPF